MKRKPQRRLSNDFLGKRVLERYRNARGTLRARIPLILRRNRAPGNSTPPGSSLQPRVPRYQFALHVHMSHLGWLPAGARHVSRLQAAERSAMRPTFPETRFQTVALRAGRWPFAPPDAARGSRTATLAPVHVALVRGARPHANVLPSGMQPIAGGAQAAAGPSVLLGRWIPRGAPAARMRESALRGDAGVLRAGGFRMHFRVDATHDTLTRATLAESLARRQTLTRVTLAESLARRQTLTRATLAESPTRRQATPLAAPSAQALRTARLLPMHAQAAATLAGQRTSSSAVERDNGLAATTAVGRQLRTLGGNSAARVSDVTARAVRQRSGAGANEVPRAPLYSQAVARSFVDARAPVAAQQAPVHNEPRPVAVPSSPAPQLDLARLSDDVYRHIERKIRIERERRGL